MAVNLTSYGGLTTAVTDWLARSGDTDITNRIDDLIALCEQRMYYGKPGLPALGIPEHEAIRVPALYQTNTSFTVAQNAAQPTGMLDLVEASVNTTSSTSQTPALEIVEESLLDDMDQNQTGTPQKIALSGNNFRFWPGPGTGTYTLTLRYYGALTTPSGTNPTNWILTNAPGVYLNGCVLEAAIMTGDPDAAKYYAMLYGADVQGLNSFADRINMGQKVRIQLRATAP